jgi:hypothetical protein
MFTHRRLLVAELGKYPIEHRQHIGVCQRISVFIIGASDRRGEHVKPLQDMRAKLFKKQKCSAVAGAFGRTRAHAYICSHISICCIIRDTRAHLVCEVANYCARLRRLLFAKKNRTEAYIHEIRPALIP